MSKRMEDLGREFENHFTVASLLEKCKSKAAKVPMAKNISFGVRQGNNYRGGLRLLIPEQDFQDQIAEHTDGEEIFYITGFGQHGMVFVYDPSKLTEPTMHLEIEDRAVRVFYDRDRKRSLKILHMESSLILPASVKGSIEQILERPYVVHVKNIDVGNY